ncbi:MAG: 50S ribosomal protein L3 [Candidatus Margulisbacteria bacterium]|nr:50S ribosomal protein L3 [Candidatus Margulisiibacteriota bacterium]
MNGLIGKKIGMTQIFDEKGNALGVTVVEVGPCKVTQVKTADKDGYDALQLLFGKKKREVRLDKPEELKVGDEIKVDIFKAGELVKVSGLTIGKGFQGTIKRYHTHRGPMSHGSKHHRLVGSASSGTTPGRVWPGRKMPGRMGGGQKTVKKVLVAQVIAEKNLLLIKGPVPGKPGNIVMVTKE